MADRLFSLARQGESEAVVAHLTALDGDNTRSGFLRACIEADDPHRSVLAVCVGTGKYSPEPLQAIVAACPPEALLHAGDTALTAIGEALIAGGEEIAEVLERAIFEQLHAAVEVVHAPTDAPSARAREAADAIRRIWPTLQLRTTARPPCKSGGSTFTEGPLDILWCEHTRGGGRRSAVLRSAAHDGALPSTDALIAAVRKKCEGGGVLRP